MPNKKDSPRVYIPPPIIYAAFFIAAIFMQSIFPLNGTIFYSTISKFVGTALILISLFIGFSALGIFIRSKNTVITMKPASSLQTTGIYSVSRNPMYLGMLIFYIGLSFLIGNWWNFVFLPLVVLTVQSYVMKREEKYLQRRFGQEYSDYRLKVRRWI